MKLEAYLGTHAILNNGFSVRAIIFLNNLLQNTRVVRLYLIHKPKKQKKDAVATNDNIQSGNAMANVKKRDDDSRVRQWQPSFRLDRGSDAPHSGLWLMLNWICLKYKTTSGV